MKGFFDIHLKELYLTSHHLDASKHRDYFNLVEDLLEEPGILQLKNYIQHSDITTYVHVISVSFIAYTLAKKLHLDYKSVARAGILHDFVTYDWHEKDASHRFHGYRHPGFAVKNAKTITILNKVEENAIHRHMWPLTPIPPRYKEAWLLTFVDKYCATRESLRKYQKHPEVI